MKPTAFMPALIIVLSSCALEPGENYAQADQALRLAGTELAGDGVCAAVAQIDGDCPADVAWRNHGHYVSCVAKYLDARVQAGDLSDVEKGALVALAAQSAIGRPGGGGPAPDFGSAIGAQCP